MAPEAEFKKAAKHAKELPDQPNDVLLKLYALYKQASSGNVKGERPGFLDIRGRAKFDAWSKQKGKKLEEAMQEYIDYVDDLMN